MDFYVKSDENYVYIEFIIFHYVCIVDSCSLFETVVIKLINNGSIWKFDLRIN